MPALASMKRILRRTYVLPVFRLLGLPLFRLARWPRFEWVTLRLARVYAHLVSWAHGRRLGADAAELAEEWNRLMPEPRERFPVVHVADGIAHVEIHFECPLRGTGDAAACWRAMEFDRRLMERSGGRLVVVESQSVTGNSFCKVQIRREPSTG